MYFGVYMLHNGLGLWCWSYVCANCVSYARQQILYHMQTKTAYYKPNVGKFSKFE